MALDLRVFVVVLLAIVPLILATGAQLVVAGGCKSKIVVGNLTDSSHGRGQLREAIGDVCDGGTILLRRGTATLERGELIIPSGKSVSIVGLTLLRCSSMPTANAEFSRWKPGNTDPGSGHHHVGDDTTAGGILNYGNLALQGQSAVKGNAAYCGGAVYNHGGTVPLADTASIGENSAQPYFGAALYSVDGIVILNDASSVYGKDTGPMQAGGIYSVDGSVTLNGVSSVHGNTGDLYGGIYNENGQVTLNDSSSVRRNEGILGGGGSWLLSFWGGGSNER